MISKSPYIIIAFILGFCGISVAQISFRDIGDISSAQQDGLRRSATSRDSTRLNLPFWDDFSQSSYLPDTANWFVEEGTANLSTGSGIAPPTINVAVFDGWNAKGTPYSTAQLLTGAGDSLVSKYIDMSVINPALRATVYISFFWQKEGRGEKPDDEDSIALQVINSDKNWVRVWSKTGAEAKQSDSFFQEILPLSDPSYFHPYFQFRFVSFGKLSGGFDTWNIDYVYLNFNRSAADRFVEDRALTSAPLNWLTTYSAMPYDQFLVNLEQNLQTTSVGSNNLDNQVQAIEYHASIRDSNRVYDVMNDGTPLNLAPGARTELVAQAIDPNAFDTNADSISLSLETRFYINSGDSSHWLNKFDLRTNDTTTTVVKLGEELAYDDGTAEWAVGLSQKAGLVAYRFVIPKSSAITAVNIYFPEFSPSSAGKTFTLIVWNDLFQYKQGRLLTEQHIVKKSDALNQFTNYTLGRPVAVSDTFYIGYEQSVDDFFPVGLDKDGTAQDGNVFINLDGVWEPAEIVKGNLMIRPVFGFKKAVGLEDEIFKDIKVFPNPNNGDFMVLGQFDQAIVFDLTGNVLANVKGGLSETEIRLLQRKRGLYFLKVLKDGKYKTFKIIVN
ncbi:MAG: T9SS type A sorting domain-containing protein [Cyclobacteriaceae bacterium]|nr:T9SS type A sorting domain-containing protein [Cyclobacteriaceae bacterium]